MRYRVRITPAAEERVLSQARHIAEEQHAPLNAARWLEKIFDAAETLE